MSTKTKTMPKAAKPLLAEKASTTPFLPVENFKIPSGDIMVGAFQVTYRNLVRQGFMHIRRNVDIINPKFLKDEYRVLYYLIIFLFPERFGVGRYGDTRCTAEQTRNRVTLFDGINAEDFDMDRACDWMRKALLKASAAK